ncbi:MAG TPA: hypothetical protein VHY20_10620, partial [Pirellulales bacterium]|nr:hypothetical protein [Pirellulales bacterium]
MPEQYANNAATTLIAGYTAGGSTLSVASTAAFPPSGSFRVAIDNELLLVHVDAGALAIDTRGLEGTTNANHASGASVTHVLTAGGLVQAIADRAPVTMVASGDDHAGGLVPDPGGTAGAAKFLREDGAWNEPSGGPSSAGDSPTVAALPNAGSGASVSVVGSDSVGQITLTTGTTSGMATGSIAITRVTAGTNDTPGVLRWDFGADVGDTLRLTVNGTVLGSFTPDGNDTDDLGGDTGILNMRWLPLQADVAISGSVATFIFPVLAQIGGPILSASASGGTTQPTITTAGV